MNKWVDPHNQRRYQRFVNTLPVQISIGSQVTLNGQLKDLSLKSAFVIVKNSIYLETNDEIHFSIQSDPDDSSQWVDGTACISRIAKGEGFAIYFTEMDDAAMERLKSLVTC